MAHHATAAADEVDNLGGPVQRIASCHQYLGRLSASTDRKDAASAGQRCGASSGDADEAPHLCARIDSGSWTGVHFHRPIASTIKSMAVDGRASGRVI